MNRSPQGAFFSCCCWTKEKEKEKKEKEKEEKKKGERKGKEREKFIKNISMLQTVYLWSLPYSPSS
jgi:predicted membrane protein